MDGIFEDRFPRGRIVRYFAQGGYGFVKGALGQDIYFHVDEVHLLGGHKKSEIREGIEVGYDVTRTPRGLHVTRMKIYPGDEEEAA